VLSEEFGNRVQFGKTYETHEEGSTRVEVRFAGGRTESCNLLVGADGARSRVRERLGLSNGTVDTGSAIWVGRSKLDDDMLEPGRPVGTLGHNLRFWMAPMQDGDTWWYAIVERGTQAESLADVRDLFADFHEPIPTAIDSADPDSIGRADILDRPPGFRWSSARVTLVGDAAHLSRPDVGQGACQSLESAIVLASLVSGRLDLPRALREYELERFARTSHIGTLSRAVAFHATFGISQLRNLGVELCFPWLAMPALDWMLRDSDT
jgi:2-polyprenyl-6-methoxyphenol hydroxylase-like FAD-dependent oxidoreductase